MRILQTCFLGIVFFFCYFIDIYSMKPKPILLAPARKQAEKTKLDLEHKHEIQSQDYVHDDNQIPDNLSSLSLEELKVLAEREQIKAKQVADRLAQAKAKKEQEANQKDFLYSLWPDSKQLERIQREIEALYTVWQERENGFLENTVLLPESFIFTRFLHQLLKVICRKEFENMEVPLVVIQMPIPTALFDPVAYGFFQVKAKAEERRRIGVGFTTVRKLFSNIKNLQWRLKLLVFALGHELAHLFLHPINSDNENKSKNCYVRLMNYLPCSIKTIQKGRGCRLEEFECDKYGIKACYDLFSTIDLREFNFSLIFDQHRYDLNLAHRKQLEQLKVNLQRPSNFLSFKQYMQLKWRIYRVNYQPCLIKTGGEYFENKYLDQVAIFLKGDDYPSNRQRIQRMKEYLETLR